MDLKYKVILINLDKDKDRLDFMTKQLNNLGLEFDRFSAINGKDYISKGGDEFDQNLSLKEFGVKVGAGTIGCTLSHKRCYEKFLNDEEYRDIKYLLILEDDMCLDDNFKNILECEIKKNEYKYRWNYVQFNRPNNSKFLTILKDFKNDFINNFNIIKNKAGFINKIKRFPYIFFAQFLTLLLKLRYYFLWDKKGIHKYYIRNEPLSGCYLIDKKVAEILLKLNDKVFVSSDIILYKYLSRFRYLNYFFYTPIIAKGYEDFKSSIERINK